MNDNDETQYTNQEAFNKAWFEVTKQGRPSHVGGICKYRGPDGTKCAIGHLLTDDELKEIAKSENPDVIENLGLSKLADAIGVQEKLLCEIQLCHDNAVYNLLLFPASNFISEFQRLMKLLAERHGLTVPQSPSSSSP